MKMEGLSPRTFLLQGLYLSNLGFFFFSVQKGAVNLPKMFSEDVSLECVHFSFFVFFCLFVLDVTCLYTKGSDCFQQICFDYILPIL